VDAITLAAISERIDRLDIAKLNIPLEFSRIN
jgi:hypothetical protein